MIVPTRHTPSASHHPAFLFSLQIIPTLHRALQLASKPSASSHEPEKQRETERTATTPRSNKHTPHKTTKTKTQAPASTHASTHRQGKQQPRKPKQGPTQAATPTHTAKHPNTAQIRRRSGAKHHRPPATPKPNGKPFDPPAALPLRGPVRPPYGSRWVSFDKPSNWRVHLRVHFHRAVPFIPQSLIC